jgi:hypothetical protein
MTDKPDAQPSPRFDDDSEKSSYRSVVKTGLTIGGVILLIGIGWTVCQGGFGYLVRAIIDCRVGNSAPISTQPDAANPIHSP